MKYTGSLIYPRLEREAAVSLFEQQRSMGLDELQAAGALTHPDAAHAATGGHPADQRHLQDVRDRVREVASDAGYPAPLRRQHEQSFDRPCGTALLESMSIVTADAADEAVWSFLSLVVLPEIGPWRFPDRAMDRMIGHPRNALRRLWWRAWSLGPDLDRVPEGCTPLGEDEFVQIMERPTLGNNPRIAKAIRDCVWRAEAQGFPSSRSELMRGITRNVRAIRSHIALDALSDDALAGRLDRMVTEVLKP